MTPWFFRFSLVLVFLSALPIQMYAASRRSAEEIRVANLAVFIQSFASNHNGQLPASWEELNANASLSGLGTPAIQDRYTLASNAPVSVELGGAQVLAVGRTPFTDDVQDGTGRFVIFRTKDGQYQSAWVLEDKIQKILGETHLTVPPQTVLQPAIPPRPPLPPMTKEQYEILKRSGLLPPHQDVSIIGSSNSAPATPSQTSEPTQDGNTSTSIGSRQPSPSPQTLNPIAEATPASDTGIPWWIYAIAVLSLGLIGSLWYFLRSKK